MAEDPESLTLQLLREMRAEDAAFRDEVLQRFDAVEERLETLETRMQGVGGMLTLIYGRLVDHEDRIASPETKPGT